MGAEENVGRLRKLLRTWKDAGWARRSCVSKKDYLASNTTLAPAGEPEGDAGTARGAGCGSDRGRARDICHGEPTTTFTTGRQGQSVESFASKNPSKENANVA